MSGNSGPPPVTASGDGSSFLMAVALFFGLILPVIVGIVAKGSWR